MVSKLLLAIQEQYVLSLFRKDPLPTRKALKSIYKEIRSGIGFNKTPEEYGAYPTDPYSHSPWGQGAKQPGMTGQVKEEIITRFVELGLAVHHGSIMIIPEAILEDQWIGESGSSSFSFSFSFCGVLFLMKQSDHTGISLTYGDGHIETQMDLSISREISQSIFRRQSNIEKITVSLEVDD